MTGTGSCIDLYSVSNLNLAISYFGDVSLIFRTLLFKLFNDVETLTEVGLAHSARQVGAAGDVVEVLRLHLFLISLAMVEIVEVGDDDGHGQRDRKHAGNGA